MGSEGFALWLVVAGGVDGESRKSSPVVALSTFRCRCGGGGCCAQVTTPESWSFLADVQAAGFVFVGVTAAAAAGVAGGEHHAVVGEGGGRDAVSGHGLAEGVPDDRA